MHSDLDVLSDVVKESVASTLTEASSYELNSLDNEIRNLQSEMMELHSKKLSGRIIPGAYAKQGSKLADKIESLKKRKDELIGLKTKGETTLKRLDELNTIMKEFDSRNTFDPLIFKAFIDEVTINDRNKITFKFKAGFSKTIIVDIK